MTNQVNNNLESTISTKQSEYTHPSRYIFSPLNVIQTIFTILMFLYFADEVTAQDNEDLLLSDSHGSSEQFCNAINMCPVALAFNFYSANYMHLFGGTHGITGRFDYEAISDSYSDNPIELSGYSFILNYRYHISGEMNSIFIGSYLRYRLYNGGGTAASTDFDMKISETTIGMNVGKRWVWESGFNIMFALGYGFASTKRETTPATNEIKSTVDSFEDEYTFFGPFLGELSIGYAF